MKLEDIETMCCRLCGTRPVDMIHLYHDDFGENGGEIVVDRILHCYNVEITADDSLSTSVCKECIDQTTLFYMTREMVKCTQKLLASNNLVQRFVTRSLAQPQPIIEREVTKEHDEPLSAIDLTINSNAFQNGRASYDTNSQTNSEDCCSVSSTKRKKPTWTTQPTVAKNIGTVIDPNNILPENDRRKKKKKTPPPLFVNSEFLANRKKKLRMKKKRRSLDAQKGSEGEPKPSKKKEKIYPPTKFDSSTDSVDGTPSCSSHDISDEDVPLKNKKVKLDSSNGCIPASLAEEHSYADAKVVRKRGRPRTKNQIVAVETAKSSVTEDNSTPVFPTFDLSLNSLHKEEHEEIKTESPVPPESMNAEDESQPSLSHGSIESRRSSSSGRIIKPSSRLRDE